LALNRAKSAEIVFNNSRRKSLSIPAPAIAVICRVTSIKVLGVTVTNHLLVSKHIGDVICRCFAVMTMNR